LRRIARIWSAIVIAFTLFMAVTHIFMPETEGEVEGYPPIENLLPVVMTLSVLGLAVAFRWEGVGGAINVGLFLVHYGLFWAIRGEPFPLRAMPIFFAAVVPGVLFLVCWWRTRSREPVAAA
jgi:hypothetical protein